MGGSSQEGRYTKLSALVALIGLLVAYLAWQYPRVPRGESQPVPQETPALAEATVTLASEPGSDASPSSSPGPPPQTPQEGERPKAQDSAPPNASKSVRACEALEPATLRADSPATVISGLVTLSITPNQLGSEKFVTLKMSSDRESRAEMVLGAPDRYRLETSRGPYFVDVTQVDFTSSTMKVQVGCERERNAE